MATKEPVKFADKDGHFRRKASQFRNVVSADPNAEFPAEKGRYVLYINLGCPWAHRTNIVRSLKGLEDVIQVVIMGYVHNPEHGWIYDADLKESFSEARDPLYGFTKHSELYHKADPNYSGRYTVPVLWDKKKETIVNNESSEIIRIFYTAFDAFIDPSLREDVKPLLPASKVSEIDAFNEWVYDKLNNGVYKTGFATTQEVYESNLYPLFAALDRLEKHLETANTNFLFGDHITEADIRTYTTIARFDVAYYSTFKCNLGMIRYDYPRIHRWLQRLYWDESEETNGGAFRKTTAWLPIKAGYTFTLKQTVVPAGPKQEILPL